MNAMWRLSGDQKASPPPSVNGSGRDVTESIGRSHKLTRESLRRAANTTDRPSGEIERK
jgi:hypothetical protein